MTWSGVSRGSSSARRAALFARWALALTFLSAAASFIACDPRAPCVPAPVACGGRRFVAVRQPGTVDCPLSPDSAAAGWSREPLVLLKGPLPDELSRTCIYTRANDPTPADLCALEAELASPAGLVSLVEECELVYPFGVEESLAESFRSALAAQAGGLDKLMSAPPSLTRVVAIDTDADRFDGVPDTCADSHGCTMAHLAKDMLCPTRGQGDCGGEVGWSLGLPQTLPGGTHYGYPSQVAAAALRAFDDWRSDVADGVAPPHLLLNLSLGWEADVACDVDGGPRTATAALRYVACNGALSVAAAGNAHRADVAPPQMACPARLESESISLSACTAQDLVDPAHLEILRQTFGAAWQPLPTADMPLLYAVGGLDYLDRPLAPVRPSARPVLAAPAIGGASWAAPLGSPAPSPAPRPISGTSVSAALVSGAAATLWAYQPAVRADEIMQALAAAAVEVTPPTPAGAGSPIPTGGRRIFGHQNVRRVALCQALSVPCLPLFSTAVNPWPAGVTVSATAVGTPDLTAGASDCRADPAGSPSIVDPQPNNPLCPHCFVTMDWNNAGRPAFIGTFIGSSAPRAMCLYIEDAAGSTTAYNLVDAARTAFLSGVNAAPVAMPALTGAARAWLAWEEVSPSNQPVTVGQPLYLAP